MKSPAIWVATILHCSTLVGKSLSEKPKIAIMPDICFNAKNVWFSGNRYISTYGINSSIRDYPYSIRLPNLTGRLQECSFNFGLGFELPLKNKTSWKTSVRYRGYQYLIVPSTEYKKSREATNHDAVIPYFDHTYFKINEILLGIKHTFTMNKYQIKPFVRLELGFARSKNWDIFLDLDPRYDIVSVLDVERMNIIPSFAFSSGIESRYLSLRFEYHFLTKFDNTTSFSSLNIGLSGHIPLSKHKKS